MITGAQIRAARKLLGWPRAELAVRGFWRELAHDRKCGAQESQDSADGCPTRLNPARPRSRRRRFHQRRRTGGRAEGDEGAGREVITGARIFFQPLLTTASFPRRAFEELTTWRQELTAVLVRSLTLRQSDLCWPCAMPWGAGPCRLVRSLEGALASRFRRQGNRDTAVADQARDAALPETSCERRRNAAAIRSTEPGITSVCQSRCHSVSATSVAKSTIR